MSRLTLLLPLLGGCPIATGDAVDSGDSGDSGPTLDCTFLDPGEDTDTASWNVTTIDAANIDSVCEGVERLCVHESLDIVGVDDLQPLSCLVSVGYDLSILATTATSLAGLESLETVGYDLDLQHNPELESLEGLGRPTIGRVTLIDNQKLTSLRGLEEVTLSELFIERNDQLASLEGLSAVHLDYLFLKLNPALTDLRGLADLESLDWGHMGFLTGQTSLQGLEGLREAGLLRLWLDQGDVASLEPLRGLTEEGEVGIFELTCSPQLTTLSGLDGLRTVESLKIWGCDELISIEALSQLETVSDGNLSLVDLPSLASLEGLGSLTSVQGNVELTRLQLLTDLRGLDALSDVDLALYIGGNENLRSLDGLEALRVVGDGLHRKDTPYGDDIWWPVSGLTLEDNPALEDLQGLHGLEELYGGATIQRNGSLPPDEIDALLLAIHQVNGDNVIRNNGD